MNKTYFSKASTLSLPFRFTFTCIESSSAVVVHMIYYGAYDTHSLRCGIKKKNYRRRRVCLLRSMLVVITESQKFSLMKFELL